jgi:hypothetical protein
MPEKNAPSRKDLSWTLGKARAMGNLVKIDCQYCHVTRHYLSGDLLSLCGDVGLDLIPRKFRCEQCDLKGYIRADFYNPWGNDIGKLKVRRLVKIQTIRRPVWEDGLL